MVPVWPKNTFFIPFHPGDDPDYVFQQQPTVSFRATVAPDEILHSTSLQYAVDQQLRPQWMAEGQDIAAAWSAAAQGRNGDDITVADGRGHAEAPGLKAERGALFMDGFDQIHDHRG